MAHYECIVVGGGMMGATVALGLAQQGRAVALLEAARPRPVVPETPPALRISSLGLGSITLLKRLGGWKALTALRSAPYREVAVWEQGTRAPLYFSAATRPASILGYMVENPCLQADLWDALALGENRVERLAPVTLQQLAAHPKGWRLTLSNGNTLTTSLLIGADGQQSRVRQQAGIALGGWQYRQQCLLITVQTAQPQQAITWQCFYPGGPRAFLPLKGHWACLAWYDTPAQIGYLRDLPLPQLTQAIHQAFPQRLGAVTAIAAQPFQLVCQQATRYYLPGLALVGDAAHTIHPLAGQGANLGFRDVAALLRVLQPLRTFEEQVSLEAALKRYQQQRYWDNRLMQGAMELIYRSFSSTAPPLPWLRQQVVQRIAGSPWLKQQLVHYALGNC